MPSVKSSTRRKSDKVWRDAISIAVHEKLSGEKTPKLRALAEKLVEEALDGDIQAMKEIGDRLDGRPKQSVDVELDAGDGLMDLMREFSRTKGN